MQKVLPLLPSMWSKQGTVPCSNIGLEQDRVAGASRLQALTEPDVPY